MISRPSIHSGQRAVPERPWTPRGLHYQVPPRDQVKLVRVARGRIRDVAVDLRVGSPTFLEHITVDLSADGGEQLLVPGEFAHGYLTLEPDTVVLYKTTSHYSPDHERIIPGNDLTVAVDLGARG